MKLVNCRLYIDYLPAFVPAIPVHLLFEPAVLLAARFIRDRYWSTPPSTPDVYNFQQLSAFGTGYPFGMLNDSQGGTLELHVRSKMLRTQCGPDATATDHCVAGRVAA